MPDDPLPPSNEKLPAATATAAHPSSASASTAQTDTPKTVEERLAELEARPPKDVWDRADIVAKFLSSVVIALVGLLITWALQRQQDTTTRAIADSQREATKQIADAQLKAAKEKEESEKTLEQGKLTVQLLDHLTSKDPAHRKLAVITFKHSLPEETYDEVTAVLAQTDRSPIVQIAAIKQLSASQRPQVSTPLAKISRDASVDSSVRAAAGSADQQVNISQFFSPHTGWVFSASRFNQVAYDSPELQHGVFTYFLLKGLQGDASRHNGDVTPEDLAIYLNREIPQYVESKLKGSQNPETILAGSAAGTQPVVPNNVDSHLSVLPHVILLPDASRAMLPTSFSPFSWDPALAVRHSAVCHRRWQTTGADASPVTIALPRHPGSVPCRRSAASRPRGATPAVVAAS